MNVGVILARFQPIHNGHMELIHTALNENDKVLILIGSADKTGERNPIPAIIRYDLVVRSLKDAGFDKSKYEIQLLNDLTNESDNNTNWGFYLYANIVKYINQSTFTMYYSDGYEIITTWFPGFILRNFVSLKLIARNSIHNGVSATLVRNKIKTMDTLSLSDLVPTPVLQDMKFIKSYIDLW